MYQKKQISFKDIVAKDCFQGLLAELGLLGCKGLVDCLKQMRPIVPVKGGLHQYPLVEHVRRTVANLEFSNEFTQRDIRVLKLAALLHDIGKIRAPRLRGTTNVIGVFSDHPEEGEDIVSEFEDELGLSSEETVLLGNLILEHHELGKLAIRFFEDRGVIDASLERDMKYLASSLRSKKALEMLLALVKADGKAVNDTLYVRSNMEMKLERLKAILITYIEPYEKKTESRKTADEVVPGKEIIEFYASDSVSHEYLVKVQRQILIDLATAPHLKKRYSLPIADSIRRMSDDDIENLYDTLPFLFDADAYIDELADSLRENHSIVNITVPLEYEHTIRRDGLVAGVTWNGQKILAGTVGRPPYFPGGTRRIHCRVKVRLNEVLPRLTGPDDEFSGVVVFASTNIPASRIEIVN